MIVSSRNRRDPSIRDFTIFLGRRKKKKEFGCRVERHRAKIRDIYIYIYFEFSKQRNLKRIIFYIEKKETSIRLRPITPPPF